MRLMAQGSDGFPSTEEEDGQGEDEKDMDEAPQGVCAHQSNEPKDYEDDTDGIKHGRAFVRQLRVNVARLFAVAACVGAFANIGAWIFIACGIWLVGAAFALAGLLTVVAMGATNFMIDSDFKWLLLAPALLWFSDSVLLASMVTGMDGKSRSIGQHH